MNDNGTQEPPQDPPDSPNWNSRIVADLENAQPAVFRRLRMHLPKPHHRETVSDLLQEVSTRFIAKLKAGTIIDHPTAWMVIVAERLAIDFLRKNQPCQMPERFDADSAPIPSIVEPIGDPRDAMDEIVQHRFDIRLAHETLAGYMHPSYNRETALAAWTLVDLGRVHTLQAVAALLAEDSHQRVDRMVRSVRTFLNEKHKGLADRLKS